MPLGKHSLFGPGGGISGYVRNEWLPLGAWKTAYTYDSRLQWIN